MFSDELKIEAKQLSVDKKNILQGMGMKLTDADDYLLETIDKAIAVGLKLVKPRAGFAVFENPQFDLVKKTIAIGKHQFKTGGVVTSMLKRSEALALFIVTVGSDVEKLSKSEMAAGNGLEGLIYDLVGSELAENISEMLHQHIQQLVQPQGQNVSNRFSPGYCNWPVSEQGLLFELMTNNHCGVSLSASSLMLPVKSVSGMIGIGNNVRRVAYKCNICNDKHCIMRRQNS